MSVAELQELEEVKALVNRGQQLGVLTFAEISWRDCRAGLSTTTDVEELHGFLERAEIEIVEEVDPGDSWQRPKSSELPDKRGRRKSTRPHLISSRT